MATPAEGTGPIIHIVIEAWLETVRGLEPREHHLQGIGVLSSAVWYSEADVTKLNQQQRELREYYAERSPFARRNVFSLLRQAVAEDPYLRAAARTAWGLAKGMEEVQLDEVIQATGIGQQIAVDAGPLTDRTLTGLFAVDYHRFAVVHLYNLSLPDGGMELPDRIGSVVALPEEVIPRITGELTLSSRLHYRGGGNTFVMFRDSGADDDMAWLQANWTRAWNIIQVLRYVKYDVVDIDWASIYFEPTWVNEIRRGGIFIMGRARWDVQPSQYVLDQDTRRTFARFMVAADRFRALLEDERSSLRKSTRIAGEYYEHHQSREPLPDQLVELVIALEALFSPGREGEYRFRIAHRAAVLLGSAENERRDIAGFMRRVYDGRSKLLHGAGNPFENGDISATDVRRLGDYVRQSLLRLSVLLARGHHDRDTTLRMIDECVYSPVGADGLRSVSDVEAFLVENGI